MNYVNQYFQNIVFQMNFINLNIMQVNKIINGNIIYHKMDQDVLNVKKIFLQLFNNLNKFIVYKVIKIMYKVIL